MEYNCDINENNCKKVFVTLKIAHYICNRIE